MNFLQNLSIEIKTCIAFGISALIFSLLIGIIYGIALSVVAIRMLIILPVFGAFGYGIVFVLKKYIPEFFEMFNKSENDILDEDLISDDMKSEEAGSGSEEEMPDAVGDDKFSEMTGEDLPQMVSKNDLEDESTFNASQGKLGKHILKNDTIAKYEPKIMAQAIRTMMLREDD